MHENRYIYPDFVQNQSNLPMIFNRKLLNQLKSWSEKSNRKPLILRGARQVGKTTVVTIFGSEFDHFIHLNLEIARDRRFFAQHDELKFTVQAIFFEHNLSIDTKKRVLLFIDEVQMEPKAVAGLRYFYEEFPNLYVIAAGSLLETLLLAKNTFPVGRVEYLVMRPVSFLEFLNAIGELEALQVIQKIPLPTYAHQKLLELFHIYALIGGMPEVVQAYAQHRDLIKLKPIYDSLLTAYIDDVQKYADSVTRAEVLQLVIQNLFAEAGQRIRFAGFANSTYGSRSVGEAMRTLEKVMLLHLVYPAVDTKLPASPQLKKAPYLQSLDTGLMNYISGIQSKLIGTKELHEVYRGKVIHHWTGQMLLTRMHSPLDRLRFWVREKKQSNAEVDFVHLHRSLLIPLEIKSGTAGRMKSLHLYMKNAPHSMAVRVYAGSLHLQEINILASGVRYQLLNLPYFLVELLPEYLSWMAGKIKEGEP